ncbi:hypothetical protein Tco_1537729 [Tanacetum coccineum]
MQKEKEQQDKLHATPTARTEPKKNEVHLHVLAAATRVPTKRKSRYNQESIIIGARRPGKLADSRRVKTVREVTRSPNQEDTCQTPTKMISLSLGHVRKETLSHLVSGISISQGQGCPATSRHMMEARIQKII